MAVTQFQRRVCRKGAEVAGRVEAPSADGAPRFLFQDAAVDFEIPIDLQGLPLGVVVGAREADAREGGRGGVFHTLHQPASRAHLHELADARGTFGQQAGGLVQCGSRYIASGASLPQFQTTDGFETISNASRTRQRD